MSTDWKAEWKRLEDALRAGAPPEDIWRDPVFLQHVINLPKKRWWKEATMGNGPHYFEDVMDRAVWEALRTWNGSRGASLRGWMNVKIGSRWIDFLRSPRNVKHGSSLYQERAVDDEGNTETYMQYLEYAFNDAIERGQDPRDWWSLSQYTIEATRFENRLVARLHAERHLQHLTDEQRRLLRDGPSGPEDEERFKEAARIVKESVALENELAAKLNAELDRAVETLPEWRKNLPETWHCPNTTPHVCIGTFKDRP